MSERGGGTLLRDCSHGALKKKKIKLCVRFTCLLCVKQRSVLVSNGAARSGDTALWTWLAEGNLIASQSNWALSWPLTGYCPKTKPTCCPRWLRGGFVPMRHFALFWQCRLTETYGIQWARGKLWSGYRTVWVCLHGLVSSSMHPVMFLDPSSQTADQHFYFAGFLGNYTTVQELPLVGWIKSYWIDIYSYYSAVLLLLLIVSPSPPLLPLLLLAFITVQHFFAVTPQWVLQTQKSNAHLLRTHSSKVLLLKSGVGQNIAMHAPLTARDFFLAIFYLPCPFTFSFPKLPPTFSRVSYG